VKVIIEDVYLLANPKADQEVRSLLLVTPSYNYYLQGAYLSPHSITRKKKNGGSNPSNKRNFKMPSYFKIGTPRGCHRRSYRKTRASQTLLLPK